MSTPLLGKIALITGGSKGIGAATAVKFASQGAKVAINFSSDTSAAESVISKLGGSEHAIAIQADAGSLDGCQKMVDATVAKWGRIDILVPNAASLPMKNLESTTEADFDGAFALNVKGPYFLAQKAVPHMSAGGRIIFVSSSLCKNTGIMPNYLLYIACKGAIEQMTRVMAKDLGRKGIVVNAIGPGPTSTELFLKGKPEAMINAMGAASPFNKLGKPEEIAETMAFMAGPGSAWVSGQILYANGAAFV